MMLIYLAQQMLETAAETAGRLLLTGTAQTLERFSTVMNRAGIPLGRNF